MHRLKQFSHHQEVGADSVEYNEEWLAGFLGRLSAFDRDMNTVVQDSGILAGAHPDQLAEAGKGRTPQVPSLCPRCSLNL